MGCNECHYCLIFMNSFENRFDSEIEWLKWLLLDHVHNIQRQKRTFFRMFLNSGFKTE